MVKKPRKKAVRPEWGEAAEEQFARRRSRRTSQAFDILQNGMMVVGIVAGVLLVFAVWLLNPASKIRSITVTGNKHLSDAYICNAAGISTDSIFFLNPELLVKNRLKKDPMIEEAKVKMAEGNVFRIEVTEKKAVGYRSDEEMTILFADQTSCPMTSDNMTIIADVPYITGFNEYEQQRRLVTALGALEEDIIADISEISQYEMPYDRETLKVLMNTGGYFVAGYDTVYMLKGYQKIYLKQKDHNQCLYAQYRDDSKSVLVSSVCPWDMSETDREYWTDESGNAVTNKYGDKIPKKYYMDSEGNYAKDASGNKIPIPIDKEGLEVIDQDFQINYENGYYDSGELKVPEIDSEDGE